MNNSQKIASLTVLAAFSVVMLAGPILIGASENIAFAGDHHHHHHHHHWDVDDWNDHWDHGWWE